VLTVPAARLSEVLRDALATLPVLDLAVEDPPLEEVMRELFEKAGAARDRPPAPARSEPVS